MMSKPSIHRGIVYDPGVGYDVRALRRRLTVGGDG